MADPTQMQRALAAVMRELVDGAGLDSGWALNPGDRGLLASLDALSAEAASARPGGRSSIAAHVDHLRYGLDLLNRWVDGETDPFAAADYSASWRRQEVGEERWRELREALARDARTWLHHAEQPRQWSDPELTAVLASAVHLAYHLGAIRQLNAGARGPYARD